MEVITAKLESFHVMIYCMQFHNVLLLSDLILPLNACNCGYYDLLRKRTHKK